MAESTSRLEQLAAIHRPEIEEADKRLTENWSKRVRKARGQMFSEGGALNTYALQNFRRLGIFLQDNGPETAYGSLKDPKRWLAEMWQDPWRGAKELAKQYLRPYSWAVRRNVLDQLVMLEERGGADLLTKYPVTETPGRPFFYDHHGYRYNGRWLRHAYLVHNFRTVLGREFIKFERPILMDLGGSYGAFSYFMKNEYPDSVHVIVDFADQLLQAAYFLGESFPKARFGTLVELGTEGLLDRRRLEGFDFVLLPVNHFQRLAADSLDVVCNFVSLGEMKREWFDTYLKSEAFRTCSYFYSVNRFMSCPGHEPTHNTDISILDYPLTQFETLHFDICPLFLKSAWERGFFRGGLRPMSSQFFEFIGRRTGKD